MNYVIIMNAVFICTLTYVSRNKHSHTHDIFLPFNYFKYPLFNNHLDIFSNSVG